MLFLLPPSETKRTGGVPGSKLDFSALSFASLTRLRRPAVMAVARLARDRQASMAALGLGPRLSSEVDRNRSVRKSPTMPALLRYTGVAFDPIDAETLDTDAWGWAAENVAIHSALFGVLRATDPVPAYRLSHDSRVPDLSLRAHWAAGVTKALAAEGPMIDLRSEGYVALGAAAPGSAYVRVVADDGGRRRALNHFNKKTKGTLIARLLASRPDLDGIDDFVEWARGESIVVEAQPSGELVLVSESVLDPA